MVRVGVVPVWFAFIPYSLFTAYKDRPNSLSLLGTKCHCLQEVRCPRFNVGRGISHMILALTVRRSSLHP